MSRDLLQTLRHIGFFKNWIFLGFQIDFEIQELFVIPEYLEISDHRDDKCEATRKYGTDKFETTRLYCSEQVTESETFLSKYIRK